MVFVRLKTLCLVLLACGSVNAGFSEAGFRNPPLEARPSALWSWLNGHVDARQITRELEEMKAKGMRGAIIWDVGAIADPGKIIPAGPAFLGPESLASIHHAMDEAQRLGLELGLFASSSWNAGGPWITPENASKELRWSELNVDGPQEFSAILPLPAKTTQHFEEVAVLAVADQPRRSLSAPGSELRLDKFLAPDGRLTWSVPSGRWTILRFVCNNTGEKLKCPSPNSSGLLIDHLSSEGADAHLNHMLEKLLTGRKDFGSLKVLMLDSYEVEPATDWTPDFLEEFQKRRGYDPTPWLPALAAWTVGDRQLSERFRHDYHKTVSDLIIDEHFVRSREILNQHGLLLLAEAGHGGSARVDPLRALGTADIPMGEFWNHRKNWVTKEAASAAHIYGKTLVNAESFTGWQNWQDGPANYKRLLDIALCAGLNQVTFHTFAHNPPAAGRPGFAYHAGEHFNVNSTWWPRAGPMLEDMSRCCYMLQQGRFVADVCVYYGDEAPNLVPARRIAPTIEPQWTDDRCVHCGKPQPVDIRSLGHGYDCDYVNEEVLLERMEVRDGKLVLPDGMSYRVLVLPDREAISPAVLRRIGGLMEAGATVVGRRPERSNSLSGYPDCDGEVRELSARIWGPCDGDHVKTATYGKGRVFWNVPLSEVLMEIGIKPDFTVENIKNDERQIDFIHRATADEDIYFVSNSTMDHQSVQCRFRVAGGRVPNFWHPEDGRVAPCHIFEVGDGFIKLPLELPPASSVFVVFGKDVREDHLVKIGESGNAAGGVGIEVLAVDAGSVSARVRQAGVYPFETARGRTGKIVVEQVPDDLVIGGTWKIEFPPDLGAPQEVTMPALVDWTQSTEPGIRYFSGTATYHKQFVLPGMPSSGAVLLDLGIVREVAAVKVNGRDAGVLWKQPYRIEIGPLLTIGENQLEIAVTNLWNNRIVGDLRKDSNGTFARTNLKSKFRPETPLLPSGLIGPVTLGFPVSVTAKSN
jgi:hypothetical protein